MADTPVADLTIDEVKAELRVWQAMPDGPRTQEEYDRIAALGARLDAVGKFAWMRWR